MSDRWAAHFWSAIYFEVVCILISHPIQQTEPNKIKVDDTHPTLYDLSISWSVNGRFTIGGDELEIQCLI